MSAEEREAEIAAFISSIPAYYDTLTGFKRGWNDRSKGLPKVMEPYSDFDTSMLPKYWEQYTEDYSRGYEACSMRVGEVEAMMAQGGHIVTCYM